MSESPGSMAAYSLEAVVQSGGLVDREEPKADRPVSNLDASYLPSEDVAAIQSDTIRLPKT